MVTAYVSAKKGIAVEIFDKIDCESFSLAADFSSDRPNSQLESTPFLCLADQANAQRSYSQ